MQRSIFDRDKVINDLWRSPDVAAAIAKMEPEDLQDDLRQELFYELCRLDTIKLQGLWERGEIKIYMFRIMWTMMRSNRSGFYNTHRKYNEEMLQGGVFISDGGISEGASVRQPDSLVHHDHPESVTLIDRVGDALATIEPYEANMIKLYAEMGQNCQPVSKATGIQVRSVHYAVNQAKQKLKKKLRANVD